MIAARMAVAGIRDEEFSTPGVSSVVEGAVVAGQADCMLDQALRMMLDRAQGTHKGLFHIVEGVIAHRIWFG